MNFFGQKNAKLLIELSKVLVKIIEHFTPRILFVKFFVEEIEKKILFHNFVKECLKNVLNFQFLAFEALNEPSSAFAKENSRRFEIAESWKISGV